MPASVRGAWLAIPDTALLLRIVLVEGSAAVDDPLVVHCDVACTQTPEHFQAPLARIPACVCLLCTHAAAQITMSA